MPRKKGSSSNIAKFTRAVAKRRKSNPDGAVARASTALQDVVAPGVVGYAAARVVGRIAYKLACKKSTALAKHVGAVAPSVVAVGTYAAASSIESIKPYRAGLLAGTGIAAAQALLQTYLPRYGWILNDYHLDDLPSSGAAAFTVPAYRQPTERAIYGGTTGSLPAPARAPVVVVPATDSKGTEDLSDISAGLGADDDFLDELEESSGQVIQFPGS